VRAPEAENAIVGRLLVEPSILDGIEINETHFCEFRERAVFMAIRDSRRRLEDQGVANFDVVADRLTRDQKIDAVGGMVGLLDFHASLGDNVFADIRAIKEAKQTRQVLSICDRAMTAIKGGEQGNDVTDRLLRALGKLDDLTESGTFFDNITEEVRSILDICERKERGENVFPLIPTGIKVLDSIIGGLKIGVVSTVAARPAEGKSTFGINVARNVSKLGLGCHFFTFEDGEKIFAQRMISKETRIPLDRIVQNNLSAFDLRSILSVEKDILDTKKMIVQRSPMFSADKIARCFRAKKKELNTKLVVIDYLQLMPGQRNAARHEQLEEQMARIAALAAEEQIAVLVCSQLNRDVTKRDSSAPRLADLRGSGAIEQVSKLVLGLHVESNAIDDDLQICILKNSFGRRGRCVVTFEREYATIR